LPHLAGRAVALFPKSLLVLGARNCLSAEALKETFFYLAIVSMVFYKKVRLTQETNE